MFINKSSKGSNNICGPVVVELRKSRRWSQRELADKLQLLGLDIDKNAIQRIEAGKRFVTDIELKKISDVFSVTYDYLLDSPDDQPLNRPLV